MSAFDEDFLLNKDDVGLGLGLFTIEFSLRTVLCYVNSRFNS
jgi:hypothetical protein